MLAQLVPAPLVRVFARPYLAGATMASALDVAADMRARGMLTTLDLLGESVTRPEQVQTSEHTYTRLIDVLADDPRFSEGSRPSVSLKPSAFTVDAPETAFGPVRRILERARAREVAVTIDMEDRSWTDVTLERTTAFFREGFDVGTVLQTRLHRTASDLERIPEGMRVRLVIGIYPEPAEVALTDKRAMKERLLTSAARLLERGARVEFATHDDAFVERFVADVAPAAPERCEIQLLLGVPRDRMLAQVANGELGPALPIRVYVPFATDMEEATAYLRRRMDESPSMVFLVLRNLFARG
ncbi:MAG: proline dehydrogenase family protein [Myxococcota bacterium]